MVECPRHTFRRIRQLEGLMTEENPFVSNSSLAELGTLFYIHYKKYKEEFKEMGIDYITPNPDPFHDIKEIKKAIETLSHPPMTETITDEKEVEHTATYYPPEIEKIIAEARFMVMEFIHTIRSEFIPTKDAMDEDERLSLPPDIAQRGY